MLRTYARIIKNIFVSFAFIATVAAIWIAIKTESFIVFFCLFFGVFLECVFGLAFSALLDRVEDNYEMLYVVKMQSEIRPPQAEKQTTNFVPAAPNAPAPEARAPLPSDNGFIICPNCGTRQRANRARCFECGIAFSK